MYSKLYNTTQIHRKELDLDGVTRLHCMQSLHKKRPVEPVYSFYVEQGIHPDEHESNSDVFLDEANARALHKELGILLQRIDNQ